MRMLGTRDVLIWDERAPCRVRPWPYEEVRTLASICVTARECDGLGMVTPSVVPSAKRDFPRGLSVVLLKLPIGSNGPTSDRAKC